VVEIKMVVGYMATKGDQKTPLKIEDHPIPEFLYKYCNLNEDNRDWAKGRKIPLTLYQTTKKEKEFGFEIIKSIG
jgi:hypothetical protein